MSNNYVKIELSNSVPYISMEYDDIESFKTLVFFMISDVGSKLFIKTIESELIQNEKIKEISIIKDMLTIMQENSNDKLIINKTNTPVINPSSFK